MSRRNALCIFLCMFVGFCEGETPLFSPSFPALVSIDEGSPPGTFLVKVHATLQSGGAVTYSLENQQWFEVNSTGHISVKKTLDREASGDMVILKAFASDGSSDPKAEKRIFCTINDLNDNAPIFQGTPYRVNVTEDTAIDTEVFTAKATDADNRNNGYGEVTYGIAGGNEEDKFVINGGTGVITVAKTLDYETTKAYELNITATDLKGAGTVTWTELMIQVLDSDDQHVNFTRGLYQASIDKESKPGTVFLTVQAEDLDTHKAPITYKIFEATDRGGLFKVDSNTGACSLAQSLELGEYSFIVTGTTPTNSIGFALVRLHVGSLFNASYETSVRENEANVTIFDLSVLSAHFNMSGAQVSIAYGAPQGMFVVDSASEVKVGVTPLDRETADKRSLVLEVKTGGESEGYAKLAVDILDDNDNTPAFKEPVPYSVSTREDLDLGTKLFQAQAFDGDHGENGTVTYSVLTGNEQGLFSLDNQTGVLSLAQSLDRETADRHVLILAATDGGNPSRQSSVELAINVTDFNDNAPVLQKQILHVEIPEDASTGTTVANVNATDSDALQNGHVTYELLEGGEGKFVIDNTTGVIAVAKGLDRESQDQYKLAIRVSDLGQVPQELSTVGFVTVSVLDVNDNSPVFLPRAYTAGAFKDTHHNHLIVRVTATDADSQLNGRILYELEPGSDNGFFSVDSETGHVTTAVSLDNKEGSKFNLNISAKDAGTPSQRAQDFAIVEIFVFSEENAVILEAGVPPRNISRHNEEFLDVLANLTGGRAFIKYLEPSGDSTLVRFFVAKDGTEMNSKDVVSAIDTNLQNGAHSKWNIHSYNKQTAPSTGARTAEAGQMSATVGAFICLAVMIGIGGVVMIAILIRKRRSEVNVFRRKPSRVTFNDSPLYIEPDAGSSSVIMATEAQEETTSMPNEDSNSSDGSDHYEYRNYAYTTDEEDHRFTSFLPPPPPGPPPPPPDDSDDDEEEKDDGYADVQSEEYPGHVVGSTEQDQESPGEESIAESVNSTAHLVAGPGTKVETTDL